MRLIDRLAVTAAALVLSGSISAAALPAFAQEPAAAQDMSQDMGMPNMGETPAQRDVRRAAMTPPVLQEDEQLQAAIGSDARPAEDVARDVYRHPYESLTFWGLTPGQTVVEVEPGRAGWWSNILQPYAAATGGTWIGAPKPAETMNVADGTADMVLVARAFHNWARDGRTEPYLAAFFKALKPGGVLAVEQHRSQDGLNVATTAPTGYVPESYVIRAAQAAGFVLEARSELNANPADDHDHAFGVWTLKPNRRSGEGADVLTPEQRAEYDAIGESDRMTLRFRKPE